jgi:hypothetical protein
MIDFFWDRVCFNKSVARKNSVLFYTVFTCAPILVAVISFFVFIVSGHEMTVSIAFTVGLCFLLPSWVTLIAIAELS